MGNQLVFYVARQSLAFLLAAWFLLPSVLAHSHSSATQPMYSAGRGEFEYNDPTVDLKWLEPVSMTFLEKLSVTNSDPPHALIVPRTSGLDGCDDCDPGSGTTDGVSRAAVH